MLPMLDRGAVVYERIMCYTGDVYKSGGFLFQTGRLIINMRKIGISKNVFLLGQ
jgi:hypothetical protein